TKKRCSISNGDSACFAWARFLFCHSEQGRGISDYFWTLLRSEISRDVSTSVDMTKISIRPATDADRDAIWKIFHEVVVAGDTYPIDPKISPEDALAYWFQSGGHAFVAERDRVA